MKCNYCGSEITESTKFCTECGAPVANEPAVQEKPEALNAPVTQPVNIAAPIDPQPVSHSPMPKEKKPLGKKKLGIVAAVVLMLIIIIAFVSVGKKSPGNDEASSSSQKVTLPVSTDYYSDADYVYKYPEMKCGTHSVSKIKVPFIKLDSADAKSANEEIKQLYNDLCDEFAAYSLQYKKDALRLETHYSCFQKGKLMSVIIVSDKMNDSLDYKVSSRYRTFCFDVSDGSRVGFYEFFNSFSFPKAEIDKRAERLINVEYSNLWNNFYYYDSSEAPEFDDISKRSEAEFYERAISSNDGFFFGADGCPNIVFPLYGEENDFQNSVDIVAPVTDIILGYVEENAVGMWNIFNEGENETPMQSLFIGSNGVVSWCDYTFNENGAYYYGSAGTEESKIFFSLEQYGDDSEAIGSFSAVYEYYVSDNTLCFTHIDGDAIFLVPNDSQSIVFTNSDMALSEAWRCPVLDGEMIVDYNFDFHPDGSLDYYVTNMETNEYLISGTGSYEVDFLASDEYVSTNGYYGSNCFVIMLTYSYEQDGEIIYIYSRQIYSLAEDGSLFLTLTEGDEIVPNQSDYLTARFFTLIHSMG